MAALGFLCFTWSSLVAASGGIFTAGHRLLRAVVARVAGSRPSGSSGCSMQAQQLCSAGSRAQLQWLRCPGFALCGLWHPLGSGNEPMSPAWADELLSTAPPGKSPEFTALEVLFSLNTASTLAGSLSHRAGTTVW